MNKARAYDWGCLCHLMETVTLGVNTWPIVNTQLPRQYRPHRMVSLPRCLQLSVKLQHLPRPKSKMISQSDIYFATTLATIRWPKADARYNGVAPLLDLISTSAPFSKSNCPDRHALERTIPGTWCAGKWWSIPRTWTTSMCPPIDAWCNGVNPVSGIALISAPSFRRT